MAAAEGFMSQAATPSGDCESGIRNTVKSLRIPEMDDFAVRGLHLPHAEGRRRKPAPVRDDMADRDMMDDGLEHQLEGTGKDLKGRVKDAAGGLLGDQSLQNEGKLDRLKGKIQDTFGKGEEDLGRKL
jgi:uncharacterized protein YjbJ (UPF0337 family)